MANLAVQAVEPRSQSLSRNLALIVAASLLMDILGRFSVPMPFSPVPLTLANFGVLLIALSMGARRAAAAMCLYLAQGAMGMPVFSPAGPGGIAQIVGPTGGYLMSYPLAAFAAGWIVDRGKQSLTWLSIAAIVGEIVLFIGGVGYLMALMHVPLHVAANWGLYPFGFGEVIKVIAAVAMAVRLRGSSKWSNLLA
ncbi:MAG TPA: biotin transporter BioY [Terriglobales bacterium]|nr:biotin transporter BioY [Terriglobales bacterium]